MTSFLNRLAARAVGLAPTAQPLVPAIFTPGFGAETRHPFPEIAIERVATPATVTESAARATLPREWAVHRSPELGSDSAQERPKILPLSEPQSEPASPALLQRDTGLSAIQPVERFVTDASLPAAEPVSLVDTARRRPLNNHAASPDSENALDSLLPKRAALRALEIRPARPAVTAASPHNQVGRIGHESPMVRITIGRIDVRAQFTSSAPVPAARQQRPATLSLDEYLKQRSEGKR
jgi:hypothetical protein